MDTPYGIFEYNANNFLTYISYQTETPLHIVKFKPQITYIYNYFKNLNKKRIVFIYENEYIDQHYLEDYASYYVRCFNTYKKTSSRIHFFELNDDELDYKKEFKKALKGEKTFIKNDNYLGYIVIRPVPKTFLAKVCLRPYYIEKNRKENFILTKEYKVSLFGIPLKINSIAFQEQDKIISACATTSLWSFFHAHPNMNSLHLPSSNVITKSSYSEENGSDREFPNAGLSTDMICRSLKAHKFSPEYFEFSKDNNLKKIKIKKSFFSFLKNDKNILNNKVNLNLLKEYIYAYGSSGLPLILGVNVKDANSLEEKGLHAVTILGYSVSKVKRKSSLLSHNLEKIYVHDDRYGPFLRIVLNDDNCEVDITTNNNISIQKKIPKEIYIPDTLIIGLYHKIRIPYIKIKNTCLLLLDKLSEYLLSKSFKSEADIFRAFIWDIHIKENSELKKDILHSKIEDKESYLTKSWPKYIWSASASLGDITFFELIFDATDIDQGNVFLDIIPRHEFGKEIIQIIKDYFNKHSDKNTALYDSDNFILGIIKYFKKSELYSETLSDLFGYLKIPRNIKPEELLNDSIVNQCDYILSREEHNCKLMKNHKEEFIYIWVIDKEGFLRLGKEYDKTEKGHPTLTDGMPARVGGELIFNESGKYWEVNSRSGRYSQVYENEKEKYLLNAIKYKFSLFFPMEKFIIS